MPRSIWTSRRRTHTPSRSWPRPASSPTPRKESARSWKSASRTGATAARRPSRQPARLRPTRLGRRGDERLFRAFPARGPRDGTGAADPHGLDVAELADALDGQFPAVAGVLHAAERQLRVGGHVAVDEDHPGRQVPDEPAPLRLVVGPRVRAEPELRAVGQLDRRLDVRYAVHGGDRAENLLLVHAHVRRDAG